jgi:serine/threonine-protein kinase PknG
VSATCTQADCNGTIDSDGYCDTCGAAAAPRVAGSTAITSNTSSSKVDKTQLTRRGATTRSTTSRHRLGAGLVDVPPIPRRDPESAVLADPRVSEERRHCSGCDSPVGRSHDETPGRTEGFCRQCGRPFSFTPKLAAGDIVASQYAVVGCLAHGGLGWVYLARDKNVVDRWVVLKGLLNTGDDDARAAALAEKRFLAEVEHPNIVKIYNFVEHEDDGYIVMEYVDGASLRDILQSRRDANGGSPDPLPVAQAIAYILEILPAISYLHDLGLLFCDFKPDNVIQSAGSLKLIDLGGVYSTANPSSAIYGTVGYQAPEIAQTGPTIPSDLFTVARTLAVLCMNFRGYQTTYRYTLPDPVDVALFAKYDSLYRFLARATAANPDDRFQSADEMGTQLLGVLREIVADEAGEPRPGVSTVFTAEMPGQTSEPDWHVLPALLVSADDPAAGFLATIAAGNPDDTLSSLRQAPLRTVEVDLRVIRTLIDNQESAQANALLDELETTDPWEWRTNWYRALDRLTRGEPADAHSFFGLVYLEVPGELAPKLGLGLAAELSGNPREAARWYDLVSRTDPTLTSACFGLARCLASLGDRAGAAAAYGRVPERSRASVDAQIARAETMLQDATRAELVTVSTTIASIPIAGERRAELMAHLFESGFRIVRDHAPTTHDVDTEIFGYPLTEHGMRCALESTYRALARYCQRPDERIELVDAANRIRPRTLI